MDNLILSMMTALDDYNYELGFNKSDVDSFIKKYDYLNHIKCNERGVFILWDNKYIDNDKFEKLMNVKIENNRIYIICNDFGDILNSDYDVEIDILNGELDSHWSYYEYYDYYRNGGSCWDDYNKETLKAIFDFCIKNECDIDGEIMTEENTKIENNDVLFKGVSLEKYIPKEDGLDDLKHKLNSGIVQAQENADQEEIYKMIKDTFIDEIGEYKWVKDKLYVSVDNLIDDVDYFLKEDYGDFEFEDENYGSLANILKEMEKFDIRFPDLDNIYASIDDGTLNEITQDILSWD